jgi:hypothetical protein
MADFLGLIFVPVLVVVVIPAAVLLPAASESRLSHPQEAEQRSNGATRGQPEGFATRPGFTRDRYCQLIEASVVHV